MILYVTTFVVAFVVLNHIGYAHFCAKQGVRSSQQIKYIITERIDLLSLTAELAERNSTSAHLSEALRVASAASAKTAIENREQALRKWAKEKKTEARRRRMAWPFTIVEWEGTGA